MADLVAHEKLGALRRRRALLGQAFEQGEKKRS
jgi:hypothetical protein